MSSVMGLPYKAGLSWELIVWRMVAPAMSPQTLVVAVKFGFMAGFG